MHVRMNVCVFVCMDAIPVHMTSLLLSLCPFSHIHSVARLHSPVRVCFVLDSFRLT